MAPGTTSESSISTRAKIADQEDEGGEELEHRDELGVDARHPQRRAAGPASASDQKRIRYGPERNRRALREPGEPPGAAGGEDGAGAGGVDVGADQQPRAGASGSCPGETTFCEARRKNSERSR